MKVKSHLSQSLLWICQQLSGYGHAIENEQCPIGSSKHRHAHWEMFVNLALTVSLRTAYSGS